MRYFTNVKTALGTIQIVAQEGAVTEVHFLTVDFDVENRNRLMLRARKQLKDYLAGTLKEFSLPLRTECSEFEQAVLDEVLKIPYGEVRTYQQIAEAVGNAKSSRAVGNALATNPIPIFIPCHRVIAAKNEVGNYLGGSLKKSALLELEGHTVRGGKLYDNESV